jgi:hypothetical protein
MLTKNFHAGNAQTKGRYGRLVDLFRLIDAICEGYDFSVKNYPPEEGKTFCNFAVQYVCHLLGYTGFDSMMASEMVKKMRVAKEWEKVPSDKVQELVNAGHFVIAGQEGDPHGHVVVCRPGLSAFSQKWNGSFVPKCMNVGEVVSLKDGVNFAFQDMPEFFVWKKQ